MKPIFSLSLFLIIFLSSCTTDTSKGIEKLDGSFISTDSLDKKIQQLAQDAQVHGLHVSIFNQNQITYQHTFGYKNVPEQSPFSDSTNVYGASLSKATFAVLVMKLVEEGIIDLDTPLESYLPKKIHEYSPQTRWHDDFSALKNDSLYHKITARMCLDHTTGFPNWRWFEPDQQLRVKFEPGSRFSYSGEGFVYLQVVLEKILGKGLEELAQEKVFAPFAMNRSSYEWQEAFEADYAWGHNSKGEIYKKDKDNEPRGGSTLETTFDDFANFLEGVLQRKYLTQASWDEIITPQIRIKSQTQFGPLSQKDTSLYDGIALSCGLGWVVIQTPHGPEMIKGGHGDGFQHSSVLFPEVGKGMLIMTNSDNGEGIFKELLEICLADTYTPWRWLNYIPYDER